MSNVTPNVMIAVTASRNKAMDLWVPFQIPAKGVEYHDKTGSEVHGFILLEKHAGNDTVYGMEEAVREGAVIQEEMPKLLINGKDAVVVGNIDKLKGHRSSALHGVEIAAGRAETAVAAKRNKL